MLGSGLDEDEIEEQAADGSFERGVDYHEAKAVLSVIERNDRVRARVTGSKTSPYTVELGADAGAVEAACTCPDDRDGWCKHVVAALLVIGAGDEEVERRPSLARELDQLDAPELRGLVEDLARSRTAVLDLVEARWETVTALQDPEGADLDPGPFRRRVLMLLHGGQAGTGHTYERAIRTQEGIEELLELTDRLTREGAPAAAWKTLEAMTDAYLEGWEKIHGLGRFPTEIVESLADAMARALEESELSASERDRIASKLETWQAEVDGFGLAGVFLPARHAVQVQDEAGG